MEDKSFAGKPPYILVKQWCDILAIDDKRIEQAVKARAQRMLKECFADEQAIINFLKANQTKRGQIVIETVLNNEKKSTEQSFKNTLANTKNLGTKYIWSGDLRNEYVSQCLQWGVDNNILELVFIDNAANQESGYKLTWLQF